MENIQAIIIDDEETGRMNLYGLLKKYCPNVTVVSAASSVKEGIEQIKKNQPHFVFLDVEMPPGNGFDILEQLSPINFEVIFTTAYNQYAIKAIKYSALDYLLKPIDIDELTEAIKKIGNIKAQTDHPAKNSRIVLPSSNGIEIYNVNEIVRCQATNNYTTFFFKAKEQMVVSKSLKNFEDILKPFGFIRLHQSHLVNVNCIKRFDSKNHRVEMEDGEKIEVSRRKKAEFIEKINSKTHSYILRD